MRKLKRTLDAIENLNQAPPIVRGFFGFGGTWQGALFHLSADVDAKIGARLVSGSTELLEDDHHGPYRDTSVFAGRDQHFGRLRDV